MLCALTHGGLLRCRWSPRRAPRWKRLCSRATESPCCAAQDCQQQLTRQASSRYYKTNRRRSMEEHVSCKAICTMPLHQPLKRTLTSVHSSLPHATNPGNNTCCISIAGTRTCHAANKACFRALKRACGRHTLPLYPLFRGVRSSKPPGT